MRPVGCLAVRAGAPFHCDRDRGFQMNLVKIAYFSDVLCIWAYISQARIDAVKKKFSDQVEIDHRFCSVFGDTAQKIGAGWEDRGGYDGFNAHLHEVAQRFPHIALHPDVWRQTRPASSASAHLFLKAIQQCGDSAVAPGADTQTVFNQVAWAFRCAFFRDCKDISRWDIQCEIAQALGTDITAIERCIHDGVAFARLAGDYQDADKMRIEGSPSFVLNDGRQKFYGNVGFHLMDANIQELLQATTANEASWC
jgi:predicted DsbA family dithiol-disulfide isomerase